MSQFINNRDTVVTDAIDGILRSSSDQLARLDGYPHIKVVVRTDADKSRVALISGGGSGHEPSHAGFVGEGMLSAAVCGDVFASPSVEAVLAGILAVTGEAGCLLIVKNYTGDRLNFGLAAERARVLGYKIRMIVIGDDIALPDLPHPRGVAGTLFVHKVAGALAAAGASLDEVAAGAERIAGHIASLGLSLDTCTVPGSPKENRIEPGMAELGLGIHGEPGVEKVSYSTADDAMNLVVDRLEPHTGKGPLVALLNNLGGCTNIEMSILAEALMRSRIGERIQGLIGPASLMTSLDMKGFSVSLLASQEKDLEPLRYPVSPQAWPAYRAIGQPAIIDLPAGLRPHKLEPSSNAKAQVLIETCCEVLINAEAELNALDAKSGDGDTGSTVTSAAKSLLAKLGQLPLAEQPQLFRSIGQELGESMGGSFGVLMAIFFTAAGEASAKGCSIQESLQAGLSRVKQVGGAQLGDRTMIDALEPALNLLSEGMGPAATAAREGANATATITQAKAGRASYVSADSLSGHNDPGAEAVAILFEKLASV